MANYASLTEKQAGALSRFFDAHLDPSVDCLIENMGEEDAFTLVRLNRRIKAVNEAQIDRDELVPAS
jgi:hypothetical protein